MKFKSEKERMQHPKASLIPELLWLSLYREQLNDEDILVREDSLDDCEQKDYNNLLESERERIWTSVLLLNPKESPERLYSFAKNKLGLPEDHAFLLACALGRVEVLKEILKDEAGEDINVIISAGSDFEAFRLAAEGGHLEVLRYLEVKTPKRLQEIITEGGYFTFLRAAENGHLEVLRFLEEKAPDQLPAMIAEDDYGPYRWAAVNGHLEVLRYLEEKAPEKLQAMIAVKNFVAFRGAAQNGHLEVLRHLEQKAPDQLRAMIVARDYQAFRVPTLNREHNIILNHLLTYAYSYNHAEAHWNEPDYQVLVNTLLTEHTQAYLNRIDEQRTEFQRLHPNGVYDFNSGNPDEDAHQALYGYYVLRHLIRQLPQNRFGEDVYAQITRLLEIPSIKALVLRNATEVSLPQNNPLGVFDFAHQPNELLRLAVNSGDERVTQQLLAIPVLRQEAERNNFYQGASGLDLRALARDRESSMTALTPQEQKQLQELIDHYKSVIKEAGGVSKVMTLLREDLKEAFLSKRHRAERIVNLRDGKLSIELPLEYEEFQVLTKKYDLNEDEIDVLNQAYYSNFYHTAWRYLSKPNHWMDKEASYVYVNDAGTERWSTFEEYQPLIAYLYCAAKDKNYPSLTGEGNIENRIDLYMRALALINRQHNYDQSRIKLDSEGNPILKAGSNEPVKEEYDDGRGDRPSCFSGVKRNLFQSLLGHPLYTPLDNNIIIQWIKEKINEHYKEVLQNYSAEELTQIKEDTLDCIQEFKEESPLLQGLRWSGEKEIQEKMEKTFKGRAAPFYKIIKPTLQSSYEEKKEANIFIDYYTALSFEKVLDSLIAEKSAGPNLHFGS